jgi:predicted TPR repeat methyltransferase
MSAPGTSEEASAELSIPQALMLAANLHQSGDLDNAETLYNRILEVTADHPDALHFLGLLNHERARSETAIKLIRRSIEIAPELPASRNNLGNVLAAEGRDVEAEEAYRAALRLNPNDANAHANLGIVLRAQGRLDEAEDAYRHALALEPKHLGALQNLGNLLKSRGKIEEAVICFCRAMTLEPGNPHTRNMLGMAYTLIGRTDEAAQVYRDWLAEAPDDPVARHLYAACTGEGVPDRAGDAYIRETFNSFAETFDARLERLDYRAPNLVAGELIEALAPWTSASGAAKPRCLDAGCGTGLCGPLIARRLGHLVGVDLSANMIKRASRHGVYDELVVAELTSYLESRQHAFDVIVSADTLVYFGSLERIMRGAARALRSAGYLIFTVEDAGDESLGPGYRLQPNGRYIHTRDHVSRVLAEAGLAVRAIRSETLRKEAGKPVAGLLVSALKPQQR